MTKRGFYRYDIWYCETNEHYCCIVSNFKNNIKSEYLNCIQLTTKLKRHPSHIDYKFNDKNIQILCENIFTVNKKYLSRKAGHIDDTETQLKINNCLESQLQLERFNVNGIDQLENYFNKNVDKLVDKTEIKEIESEIYKLSTSEQYKKCLDKCNELADKLKNSNMTNIDAHNYYVYYYKALMNIKMKDYNQALKHVQDSLKYVGDISSINKNYAYSMLLLTSIYSKLNDTERASKAYNSLAKYYKKINHTNLRISCIFNKAKLRGNTNRMRQLIKITENIKIDDNRTDLDKKNLLIQMNEELQQLSN